MCISGISDKYGSRGLRVGKRLVPFGTDVGLDRFLKDFCEEMGKNFVMVFLSGQILTEFKTNLLRLTFINNPWGVL